MLPLRTVQHAFDNHQVHAPIPPYVGFSTVLGWTWVRQLPPLLLLSLLLLLLPASAKSLYRLHLRQSTATPTATHAIITNKDVRTTAVTKFTPPKTLPGGGTAWPPLSTLGGVPKTILVVTADCGGDSGLLSLGRSRLHPRGLLDQEPSAPHLVCSGPARKKPSWQLYAASEPNVVLE